MPEIKLLKAVDVLCYRNEILNLLNECMIATYSKPVADSFLTEKLSSLEENIARGKAYAFIAVEGKDIFGFLWSYPVKTPINQRFHVAYLSVNPRKRGKGIGRLLLREAEKQAKKIGIDEVELAVSKRNNPAIDFYAKCGYGTEKLVLEKILSDMG